MIPPHASPRPRVRATSACGAVTCRSATIPQAMPPRPKIPSTPNSIRLNTPSTSDAIAHGFCAWSHRAYASARSLSCCVSRPNRAIRRILGEGSGLNNSAPSDQGLVIPPAVESQFRFDYIPAAMIRVLHLRPLADDYQTDACIAALVTDSSKRTDATVHSIGRGGTHSTTVSALIGLRRGNIAADVVHAWGMRAMTLAALGTRPPLPILFSATE